MRAVATSIVLALVVSACTAAPDAGKPTPASQSAGQAVRGGRIVQAIQLNPPTLQPVLAAGGPAQLVTQLVYAELLRTDPDTGDLKPGLAERFETSADGLTVTFTLRDGLTWSDGAPFTGEDYRYTVEATLRSKLAPRKSAYRGIAGAQDYSEGKTDSIAGITIDNSGRTIAVRLLGPSCGAARLLATSGGSIPRHLFVGGWNNKTTDTTKTIDDHPLNLRPPAATGPFVFKEFRSGVDITLVRNDRYYLGAPLIDEYVLKIFQGDPTTSLVTGEVTIGSWNGADVDRIEKDPSSPLKLHRQAGVSGYTFIAWNQRSVKAPWLANRDVRQALSYGVNVKLIVDKILFGLGHPISTHTPQSSWAYSGAGLNTYDFNPAKAGELLQRAGATRGADGIYRWTDGRPMAMRLEGVPPFQPILEVIQEQYKTLGIPVEVITAPVPVLSQHADSKFVDSEGIFHSRTVGPDPDAFAFWHSTAAGTFPFNWVAYANPIVDRALESGRNGPDCSRAARARAYATFDKQLNEDVPFTFLYAADTAVAVNKAVQGFALKPWNTDIVSNALWNVERLWIKR